MVMLLLAIEQYHGFDSFYGILPFYSVFKKSAEKLVLST